MNLIGIERKTRFIALLLLAGLFSAPVKSAEIRLCKDISIQSVGLRNLWVTAKVPPEVANLDLNYDVSMGTKWGREVLELAPIFLSNVSNSLSKSQKKKMNFSLFYFHLKHIENELLKRMNAGGDSQPVGHKELSLNVLSFQELQELLTKSYQLVFLQNKNSELKDLEMLYNNELSKILKKESLEDLDEVSTLSFLNQVEQLEESFLRSLKSKRISFQQLPANALLQIPEISQSWQPQIVHLDRAGKNSWQMIEPQTLELDGKLQINEARFLKDLADKVAQMDLVLLPFWLPRDKSNSAILQKGAQLQIAFPSELEFEKFHNSLEPHLFYLKSVRIERGGTKISDLYVVNTDPKSHWKELRLPLSELLKLYQVAFKVHREALKSRSYDLQMRELPVPDKESFAEKEQSQEGVSDSPRGERVEESESVVSNKLDKVNISKSLALTDKNREEPTKDTEEQRNVRKYDSLLDKEIQKRKFPSAVISSYQRFLEIYEQEGLDGISKRNGFQMKEIYGSSDGTHRYEVRLNRNYRLYFVIAKLKGERRVILLHIGNHDQKHYFQTMSNKVQRLKLQGYEF